MFGKIGIVERMKLSEMLKIWKLEKASPELCSLPSGFYREARESFKEDNSYEAAKMQEILDDVVAMRQHKMLMGCLREIRGGEHPANRLEEEERVYSQIYAELRKMRTGEGTNNGVGGEIEGEKDKIGSPAMKVEDGNETEVAKKGSKEGGETRDKEQKDETGAGSEEAGIKEGENKEERVEGEKPASLGERAPEGDKGKGGREKDVFKGKTENKALRRVRFLKPMPSFIDPNMQTLGPFEEGQEVELDEKVVGILLKNNAVEIV